jgi:drug/metabolite transporter (DMT)-like permease
VTSSETREGFAALDWGLLAAIALMWGASFLFIELGIDDLEPALVAFLRLAIGAATLALFPAARRPISRSDWPLVVLLGVVWMAIPFPLLGVAQQWIDSSLTGMLHAATPLFTALVAAAWLRQPPSPRQAAGLLIGFAGVVAITAPSLGGAEASAAGIGVVLLVTLFYGFAFNLAGPLQERSGALPVLLRAELVAAALDLPFGLAGIPASSFSWSSLLAMLALGAFGTGLAFICFSVLVGRVGATRASVSVYFVPAVAIVLGAAFRDERIYAIAVLGTALVTLGAYLTSRRAARLRAATGSAP